MGTSRKERDEFNRGYARLLIYQREFVNMDVPEGYITPDGYALWNWVEKTRKRWREGTLAEYQIERLARIGFAKYREQQNWEYMYHLVMEYREKHGGKTLPVNYCTEDGVLLGAWLSRQKRFANFLDESKKQRIAELDVEGR